MKFINFFKSLFFINFKLFYYLNINAPFMYFSCAKTNTDSN